MTGRVAVTIPRAATRLERIPHAIARQEPQATGDNYGKAVARLNLAAFHFATFPVRRTTTTSGPRGSESSRRQQDWTHNSNSQGGAHGRGLPIVCGSFTIGHSASCGMRRHTPTALKQPKPPNHRPYSAATRTPSRYTATASVALDTKPIQSSRRNPGDTVASPSNSFTAPSGKVTATS